MHSQVVRDASTGAFVLDQFFVRVNRCDERYGNGILVVRVINFFGIPERGPGSFRESVFCFPKIVEKFCNSVKYCGKIHP